MAGEINMTKEFTRDDYAGAKDTDFVFSFSSEYSVTMKLADVSEQIEKHRQRRFVLTFTAPEETPVVQGTAPFSNEKLGEGSVFIVPVGKDKRGMLFESVFNTLVEPDEE
jgi:hypothetical protein